MKRAFGFLALVSAFFVFGSQAVAAGTISCSNGDLNKMGDTYYQIDLLEDGITFSPYEGSFTIDAADVGYDAGTFVIVNKSTTVSSEGEENKVVVNAMLTLNAAQTELNVALSFDNGAYTSYTMACTTR